MKVVVSVPGAVRNVPIRKSLVFDWVPDVIVV
jgi:hypothetical protein